MDSFSVFMATVEDFAWIGWIVLIALFLVIEMLTLDFTFLMLSLGSAFGLVSDLIGFPLWAQVIIAALAAVLLILLLRPPLLRRLRRGGDPARSNVAALIDMGGIVLHETTGTNGQVKLANGEIWTARAAEASALSAGSRVRVVSIEGATALVRPASPEEF